MSFLSVGKSYGFSYPWDTPISHLRTVDLADGMSFLYHWIGLLTRLPASTIEPFSFGILWLHCL